MIRNTISIKTHICPDNTSQLIVKKEGQILILYYKNFLTLIHYCPFCGKATKEL